MPDIGDAEILTQGEPIGKTVKNIFKPRWCLSKIFAYILPL